MPIVMRLPDRKGERHGNSSSRLVIRAKRTVFPDGIRPCAVLVSNGVIGGIDDFDAPVDAAERNYRSGRPGVDAGARGLACAYQ